ncbi:MAG: hypothetical protein ACREI9_07705 [Nitrospiraceae bacterium]
MPNKAVQNIAGKVVPVNVNPAEVTPVPEPPKVVKPVQPSGPVCPECKGKKKVIYVEPQRGLKSVKTCVCVEKP